MNSAPKISNSLAQQLNLMASALLPALPPFDKTAPDVAALLKRLTKSEDDQDIAQSAAVWRASAADPLRHQPAVRRTAGWRKKRGLDAKAVFGASKSGNFQLIGKVGEEAVPMSRAEFYALTLRAFEKAVAAINPGTDPKKWQELAAAFMTDAVKDGTGKNIWPPEPAISGLKASQFAQQLLRDCLTEAMGMLDGPPATSPPLLVALGEHRRSGNHYTREDAELRRNELIKELQKPAAPAGSPA